MNRAAAPKAVVLDFDGVVLDSAGIKTAAFAELFAHERPEHRDRVMEHHRLNAGISRYEKFRWANREVFGRPYGPDEEKELGHRYNAIVEARVMAAAFIPGALEFLKSCPVPLFVASGTPEEELRRIVKNRGLESYFRGVYGSPRRKGEILKGIASDLGILGTELAMVGDATADLEGASAVGARFIGVVAPGEKNPFPPGAFFMPDLVRLSSALGL